FREIWRRRSGDELLLMFEQNAPPILREGLEGADLVPALRGAVDVQQAVAGPGQGAAGPDVQLARVDVGMNADLEQRSVGEDLDGRTAIDVDVGDDGRVVLRLGQRDDLLTELLLDRTQLAELVEQGELLAGQVLSQRLQILTGRGQ